MIDHPIAIKRILFATDLSENAKHAFAYATSLANQYKAKISIIHIIDNAHSLDRRITEHISADEWKEIQERHFQEARNALIGKKQDSALIHNVLDTFCENAKSEMPSCQFEMDEIIVRRGHPVEEIIEASKKTGCDMIVMGSHGYGTLKDAMLGGTARRILRRVNMPVLLVRSSDKA